MLSLSLSLFLKIQKKLAFISSNICLNNYYHSFRPKLVKEELRRQPEKVILSEVRQVVQQMQAVHQHLEDAVSLHLKI